MSHCNNREQTANAAIRAALAQAKAADVPTIDLAEALALLRVFGGPGVRADVADSGGGADGDTLRQAQGEGGPGLPRRSAPRNDGQALPDGVTWDGSVLLVDLGRMELGGVRCEGGCMVFRPAERAEVYPYGSWGAER